MTRVLRYQAGPDDEGRPLRDILKNEFHLVAHDLARAKYRTEQGIAVNGEVSLTSRILHEGDVAEVRLAGEDPRHTVPVEGPLEILYEDEDLICLNKEPGMVVHPSHGHFADTLGNYLAFHYLSRGEQHEIRMVGRLDKDTSGAICFAKSRTACAILSGQTEGNGAKGGMRKEYLALASGIFAEPAGTVDAPISREYEEKIRRVVRADGAEARTHYKVLEQFEGYALLSLTLETGRTHQIRVHMAHTGHPLLGDPIYGDADRVVLPPAGGEEIRRAALHAYRLCFAQPFSGQEIEVTAPLPEDMACYLPSAYSFP